MVEDEPLVSSLLGDFLAQSGFEVKSAATAIEATKIAAKFDPDVAVLDINLGQGANGVELAYILDQKFPGIALMLLTKHPDLRTAGFSPSDVPAGCGFLRKDLMSEGKSVLRALEEVIANKTKVRQDNDPDRPFGSLTKSQVEVLRLISQGYTNSVIAEMRQTSVRAVELILNAIYTNLNISVDRDLNPRVEAVRQFITAAGKPERE